VNGQELKSPEVNFPEDARHLAEVAKVVASPAERVELDPTLRRPQPVEGGAFDVGGGAELLPSQQTLSGAAIDRSARAVDPSGPEFARSTSPEAIYKLVNYIQRIGELISANRREATKISRDDFTLAA